MKPGLLLVLLGLTAGCGQPIVGIWVSDKKLGNGEKNELVLQPDGSGEAEIYAAAANLEQDPSAYVRLDFEVTWEEVAPKYELELECESGPCNNDDFDLSCFLIEEDDGQQFLDCESSDDKWRDYIFNFQREA